MNDTPNTDSEGQTPAGDEALTETLQAGAELLVDLEAACRQQLSKALSSPRLPERRAAVIRVRQAMAAGSFCLQAPDVRELESLLDDVMELGGATAFVRRVAQHAKQQGAGVFEHLLLWHELGADAASQLSLFQADQEAEDGAFLRLIDS
jgi:hypothetical protein